MGRRTALALTVIAAVLTVAVMGLSAYLFGVAREAVQHLLEQRIHAVGTTAARFLEDRPARTLPEDVDSALADLSGANQLDAAYIVDDKLSVVADARGRRGRRANLLKLDPDRVQAALHGRASVGWAFNVESERFLGGYFPASGAGPGKGRPAVLVLEAGEAFVQPSTRLRAAAVLAFVLEGAFFAVALLGLLLALRAGRRELWAYGQAERAGVASRMAAMVAHEVRNPLGTIRGGAELLRERLTEPADRELADDILAEVARINRLTEDFVALGRELVLQTAPVELVALCQDVAQAVRLQHPGSALTVEVTGTAAPLEADGPRLRQALLNLVQNAAEATSARGTVRLSVSAQGAFARIAVSDDGPGVSPEVAARLFEPFVTGKAKGTGLGLAIARRIVERHGGRLDHVAAAAPGTTFEILLPEKTPR
jgi:signal transduction histidine kinase